MSTETGKAPARRFYDEVLNAGRIEIVDELVATDYREHDPLPGQREGREGVKDRVTSWWRALDDVIAEGDRVVVRWTNSATHSGTFLGISPTGRSCRFAGIAIFRLEGGILAEHWHVVDQLSKPQQLELLPSP
ncbi:ester cyclase [Streptomyces sp. NPDC053367]|uniref:ester cyclase n=1 Tax=Streptomyces sp. NPDC053367 TaxID=3365700 RepID=UPI0037CF8A22